MKAVALLFAGLEQARAFKQTALRRLGTIGQAVGVGITRVAREYAIKVSLSEPVAPGTELPTEIDGIGTRERWGRT